VTVAKLAVWSMLQCGQESVYAIACFRINYTCAGFLKYAHLNYCRGCFTSLLSSSSWRLLLWCFCPCANSSHYTTCWFMSLQPGLNSPQSYQLYKLYTRCKRRDWCEGRVARRQAVAVTFINNDMCGRTEFN
jgi:hypothetical protein